MGTALTRPEFTSQWSGENPDTDDGSAGPIAMGINFNFYGNTFDSIHIAVNGQLSFTDHIDWITTGGYTTTIPGMGWDNILCPLAADLMAADAYPSVPQWDTATGTIYYYHDVSANSFTIEYDKITNHHYLIDNLPADTMITFQVVLDADDNSIIFYYKDLGIADEPVAKRATIGIQPSKDGDLGVQYYGGGIPENGYPVNETAIKFYPRTSTDIEPNYSQQVVSTYELFQNYPNPFNPTTTIGFELKKPDYVKLTIYSILGEEVKTILDGKMQPGYHQVLWDGTDNSKSNSASGVYIYTLKTSNSTKSRKMILLK